MQRTENQYGIRYRLETTIKEMRRQWNWIGGERPGWFLGRHYGHSEEFWSMSQQHLGHSMQLQVSHHPLEVSAVPLKM